MRELSDEILLDSAKEMFYGLIHPYMEFYEKREYSKVLKLVVYSDIIFMVSWKKCLKKHFLVTTFFPNEHYKPTDDDIFLLKELNSYLTPTTIKKITEWYRKIESSSEVPEF